MATIQKFFLLTILLMGSVSLNATAFADESDDLALERQLSAEYLARMATEANAQVVEEGVVIRPIFTAASTVFPQATDMIRVSYHLMDREGHLIEESISADEIVEFPLNRLIRCWQIALPKMSVGSFYKVSCPADTAYGDTGAGDGLIKPGAALTFRLTLFGTSPAAAPAAKARR